MSRPLLRPPALAPGATIGVFCPSSPVHSQWPDKYRHGLSQLCALGFNVIEGELTASGRHQGYRTGTPRERAAEFMSLIRDPTVHGLMSVIGGANSSSLIPHLDFDAIRDHPKVVCGYSDVTSLHLAMLTLAGVSSFYGPAVAPSFGEWPEPAVETTDSFLAAVQRHRSGPRELLAPERWSNHLRNPRTDEWRTVPRQWRPQDGWTVLRPGTVTAPIIVANLNTLLTSAGTPTFPDLRDVILLIEEMSAPFNTQERNLRQLQRLGVFEQISGLIVGKPEMPDALGAPFSYHDLIMETVDGAGAFPIVADFDCGHTTPMLTIAQRVRTTLIATAEGRARVIIEEPMVA